ncbi:MAG: thiamine phosphate synthase [Luteitalea sp.]|nr:thiamine phosphate synthase [Luteitalea sp.]
MDLEHLPPLYAIVDVDVAQSAGYGVAELAERYLVGGARWLQLRAKAAGSRELLAWIDAIQAHVATKDACLIINDRVDVALVSGARGVHVGQDDLPVEAVRRVLRPSAIVGLSTHTPAQVDAAVRLPVSYIAVGPVFATRTKDAAYDAVGCELVRYAAERARPRPVVAIGGITLERAPEVLAAGATAVAIISDLLVGADPEARTRAFVERLPTYRAPDGTV